MKREFWALKIDVGFVSNTEIWMSSLVYYNVSIQNSIKEVLTDTKVATQYGSGKWDISLPKERRCKCYEE
jgi:hypothetical protein